MLKTTLLRQFMARVSKCTVRKQLPGVTFDLIRCQFGVNIAAIGIADAAGQLVEGFLDGIRYSDHEEHDRHWRSVDPLHQVMFEQGVPVRCGQLYNKEAWSRTPLMMGFGRKINVEAYMMTPLYGHGQLTGAVSFCRKTNEAHFDASDLELATAMSGFLSCSLSSLPLYAEAETLALTVRERQIALLAARGDDNPAISRKLGIARDTVKQALSRVYAKLGVSGRVQLAAQLIRRGWL